MNVNLIKRAENLLKKCNVCTVASVTEKGYPRICVLAPLRTNGIKEFWFSTAASGNKVRHFLKNDKAGVTFFNGGDSVTLTGTMELVGDKAVKDALWEEHSGLLSRHFTNGGKDDPEYCILRFTAGEATVYIDREFETFEL